MKSHTLIINSCYSVNVYIINRSPKTVIKKDDRKIENFFFSSWKLEKRDVMLEQREEKNFVTGDTRQHTLNKHTQSL